MDTETLIVFFFFFYYIFWHGNIVGLIASKYINSNERNQNFKCDQYNRRLHSNQSEFWMSAISWGPCEHWTDFRKLKLGAKNWFTDISLANQISDLDALGVFLNSLSLAMTLHD